MRSLLRSDRGMLAQTLDSFTEGVTAEEQADHIGTGPAVETPDPVG